MSEREERTPVVVGVGQLIQRDADPREALDPLAMLAETARRAAADAGAGDALLRGLDACAVVDVMAWRPRNPPGLLAEALGAAPAHELLTPTGGEGGLVALNRVAELIAAGHARSALVAGCNNVATLMAARSEKLRLAWPDGGRGEPTRLGEERPGSSSHEEAHGLRLPVDWYPLFENALRAARGRTPGAHQEHLGRLMSRFTEVAAKNPYAWFPGVRSADELITVSETNRLIAWPYPKYLNAVMATDQGAALVLTSAAHARRLGIPEERWVWWHGGARGQETVWFAGERERFTTSPALRATALAALARAGLEVGEIDLIDLYSCFPVAVEMACAELGIAEDDPRGLTVTGGLPYAGGPGNAYTLASAATMVARLRERPAAAGLLTGLGWYFTKHAATVLGSAPPGRAALEPPRVEPAASVPVAERAEGAGRIEAYTVSFGRDGAPRRGILAGRLESGERFLANTPEDPALLLELVESEGVGRRGRLAPGEGHNVFTPR
jgi:acetyl-CoA C-acetyltransferase